MNPGSQEAIESGCRCDRVLNRNGRGKASEGGWHEFFPAQDCPVHGDAEEPEGE